MTNVFDTVRDYSLALFGALVAAGLDEKQAIDCARNIAGPLAWLPGLSVRAVVMDRLYLQRGFGLQLGEGADAIDLVEMAIQGCDRVPRFHDPLPVEDTRRALSEPCEVDEPSIADELEAEFGGIFDEPRARVDSDRSPRSAEVGRAPTGGAS